MKRQYGVAIIFTLWAIALLSLLMGSVVLAMRVEGRQSGHGIHYIKALSIAEAGIALAIKNHISTQGAAVEGDERPAAVDFGGARISVEVRSERGKLDLNYCNLESFKILLQYNGASRYQIGKITEQLQRLRGRPSSMVSLDELRDFPAMTEVLYQRLSSQVTLWTGLNAPSPRYANDDLREAFRMDGEWGVEEPGSIMDIRSKAMLENGFKIEVSAVVHIRPVGRSELYRVLHWQERVIR
ncbi:general secretion pathway protein GspK [Phytopseudomonas daroniae]|uniref:general secretion pathway protein GspK n=1 Tax=Phytopseudomonas daroniae TaxID=2487519 RepID=UPI0010383DBA|nr:general secretion pathway protein GspK [Pseudomonas daroniae]TBU74084.1 general secretion pathway protein GspK [Pseudomonas daroniae]